MLCGFCFFKQKTAYEMRISDWSSDVCSSDLAGQRQRPGEAGTAAENDLGERLQRRELGDLRHSLQLGRAAGEIEGAAGRDGRRAGCGPRGLDLEHPRGEVQPSSEERRVGKECGSTCRYRV